MNKYVLGVGAAATAAAAMAAFGTATAVADDYVGQTYADASEAMDEEGITPIVAARIGDKLEQDDCIVTTAWNAPFLRDAGDEFAHAEDEMLVSLNCAGGYATATNPGAPLASPRRPGSQEGRRRGGSGRRSSPRRGQHARRVGAGFPSASSLRWLEFGQLGVIRTAVRQAADVASRVGNEFARGLVEFHQTRRAGT
jgi:hypothetical protein